LNSNTFDAAPISPSLFSFISKTPHSFDVKMHHEREREREREEGNRNLECKHGYHMAVELHNKNRGKMGVKE